MPLPGKRSTWIWSAVAAVAFALFVIAALPWGPTITKTYELGSIESVNVGHGELVIVQDMPESTYVEVVSDVRLVPFVLVTKDVGALKLGFVDDENPRAVVDPLIQRIPATSRGRLRFVLHTRQIPQVNAMADGRVTVGALTGPELRLTTTSSGDAVLRDLRLSRLRCEMGGSGDVVAEGEVRSAFVENSGSGHFDGSDLSALATKKDVSGTGTVNLGSAQQ